MDAHPAAAKPEYVVVVMTGGDPVSPSVVAGAVTDPDLVIAADSGLDHAVDAGLTPDVLIGDLDSVSAERLAAFRARDGEIVAHPVDKDDTDLALAVGYAIDRGATAITVLGGAGDRLSHVLGNCAAVAHAVRRGVATTWHADGTTVRVAAPGHPIVVTGRPADLVSLLPFAGAASVVTTSGLRWELDGETLHEDATRGVSNEMLAERAEVAVGRGLLFVIHERNAT